MFENVKFDDAFKTECGKKAVYWYQFLGGTHILVIDNALIAVNNEGKAVKTSKVFVKGGKSFGRINEHDCNIVGKWIED